MYAVGFDVRHAQLLEHELVTLLEFVVEFIVEQSVVLILLLGLEVLSLAQFLACFGAARVFEVEFPSF